MQAFKVFCLLFMILPRSLSAGNIHVAVSSNFLHSMKILKEAYESQFPDSIILVAGSTGKLTAQILHGAPFDVLLAADRYHVQKLIDVDRAIGSKKFSYAQGVLVLWNRAQKPSISELTNSKIAIARPEVAPYGKAAIEVLHFNKYWTNPRKKILYGESVTQALQFAMSDPTIHAIIALSQAKAVRAGFYQMIPPNQYAPIDQVGVLLAKGVQNKGAHRLIEFLQGSDAHRIIHAQGYIVSKRMP